MRPRLGRRAELTMSERDAPMTPASVKLVIWDLDEVFWQGTLSEGGMTPVQAHVDMVRSLVDRGIMCAVCSKNDRAEAQKALESLGVNDLFVFSHIDWTPKGQAIAAMLADMGLRAENAVFLDDNHLNLEEAQFFNPGLTAIDPTGRDITTLLDEPGFTGKDDTGHSRLAQYKVMERKRHLKAETGLSNEAFLRKSDVRIRVITDIDDKMDRVIELLNRTNQLNYTKVRANTAEERAALAALLKVSGVHAGLVEVQDRYGDYGIVGFFCVRTRSSGVTVQHLAFSCRTLNMGIEQWVWEHLGRPKLTVVPPIANPVQSFAAVDWIRQVSDFGDEASGPSRKLCLVGGCDLQQVSFYCGTDRVEFVNKLDGQGLLVRYDDVGFFLNPRDPELQSSRVLTEMVGYEFADMIAFDDAVATSDVILLSMFFSVPVDNLFTFGGPDFGGKYWATLPPVRLKQMMRDPTLAIRFAKSMFHRRLTLDERLALTREALAHAAGLRKEGAALFVLGAVAGRGAQAERARAPRLAYNAMACAFCAATPGAVFVDIEALLAEEDFNDSDHYTRTGYFKIADFVNRTVERGQGASGQTRGTPLDTALSNAAAVPADSARDRNEPSPDDPADGDFSWAETDGGTGGDDLADVEEALLRTRRAG